MATKVGQLSVLVVEDHAFQRAVALRLLAQLGVERVQEAADGDRALALLQAQATPLDVVLLDLDLPGMDGIEIIGRIAEQRLAQAIVVLTALDPALLNTVQIMARASGMRVLDTLEKPLTAAKLQAALDAFFTIEDEPGKDPHIDLDAERLAEALASSAIVPYFQPQVALSTAYVTGVEALARWKYNGHSIPPARFIPELERAGLIDPLTDHMLEQACLARVHWLKAGLDLEISVNVSMHNLADVASADRYQMIVQRAGVEPRDVTLEITESAMMHEAANVLNVLARLRLKGFNLSVDDFGTGWSSLTQLAQLPVTELKVDQGFVHGAAHEPRKRAVVEASIDLGAKLGLITVAEGVQTVEEWQMLAELGCSRAQGMLIGMPVAAEELPDLVQRWRKSHA